MRDLARFSGITSDFSVGLTVDTAKRQIDVPDGVKLPDGGYTLKAWGRECGGFQVNDGRVVEDSVKISDYRIEKRQPTG